VEQLVYISTSRSPGYVPEGHVRSILEVSRKNNLRDSLTGLLLVAGRRFLQVLEGPSPKLSAAYDRISIDDRHFALVQLTRRFVTERSFPNWAMGYEHDGHQLSNLVEPMLASVTNPSLKAEFMSFAQRHDVAARFG